MLGYYSAQVESISHPQCVAVIGQEKKQTVATHIWNLGQTYMEKTREKRGNIDRGFKQIADNINENRGVKMGLVT